MRSGCGRRETAPYSAPPFLPGCFGFGFGLFRALEGGYELWMAALDISWRGKGHGHALLDSLFATPSGRKSCPPQNSSAWNGLSNGSEIVSTTYPPVEAFVGWTPRPSELSA